MIISAATYYRLMFQIDVEPRQNRWIRVCDSVRTKTPKIASPTLTKGAHFDYACEIIILQNAIKLGQAEHETDTVCMKQLTSWVEDDQCQWMVITS